MKKEDTVAAMVVIMVNAGVGQTGFIPSITAVYTLKYPSISQQLMRLMEVLFGQHLLHGSIINIAIKFTVQYSPVRLRSAAKSRWVKYDGGVHY